MKFIIIAVLLLGSLPLIGQEWQFDLDKASKMAKEENKTVLLVFQGSDWCGPCMMLEKDVWETESFKRYAKENLVLVKVDFPRKKKNKLSEEQTEKNEELAEAFNQSGHFPLVVVLNDKNEVIGKTGYKKMSVDEYIQHLDDFIN